MKEVIIRELEGDRCIVYGLDWAPLIGSKLDKQSLTHARRVKASHVVPALDHSSSVGTCKVSEKRALFSAGAIVALKHPTSAYLGRVPIEEDRVWVIATHNGSVIKGTDTVCSPDEADVLIENIRRRYPQIATLDDSDVQAYLNERTQLKAVRYGMDAVPTPLKFATAAALALIVGNLAWDEGRRLFNSYTRSQSQTVQIDAAREWNAALDNWAKATLVDGSAGYAGIFEAVLELSLDMGNWKLKKVECDASDRLWRCGATFNRGRVATNESFLAALQASKWKDWRHRWIDLDTVLITGQTGIARQSVIRPSLPAHTDFSVEYISRLQHVSKAFSLIEIKPTSPVPIKAPVSIDSAGNRVPIAKPANITVPNAMAFNLRGPLRSLAAFPLNDNTRVTRLQFDVDPNESRPDLRNSALYGEIRGEYYVD